MVLTPRVGNMGCFVKVVQGNSHFTYCKRTLSHVCGCSRVFFWAVEGQERSRILFESGGVTMKCGIHVKRFIL